MTHRLRNSAGVMVVILLALLSAVQFTHARTAQDGSGRQAETAVQAQPNYCVAAHRIGRIGFTISNFGRFGTGQSTPYLDCFTGTRAPDAAYPTTSGHIYLFKGGLWIGAVVGRDTLVTTATEYSSSSREFHPDPKPFGEIITRSKIDPNSEAADGAVSEQDFIVTFTDTYIFNAPYLSYDAIDNRPHKPLGVEVTQKSYTWSYSYADDIILFDYTIRNIGDQDLDDMFIGFYMDGDVTDGGIDPSAQLAGGGKQVLGATDDITGFLFSYATGTDWCPSEDTIRMAWSADADGDWGGGRFNLPNVTGIRFLKPLPSWQKVSYNWWTFNYNAFYDFGPQARETYRWLGGGYGSPVGDRNKYHLLSNGEIDYDQIFGLKIENSDPVWVKPNTRVTARTIQGADIQYLLSYGPESLRPGEQLNFPVAFVGGEGYHWYPPNVVWNLRNAYRPERYYEHVNFESFVRNAIWASWIYDNPGVDTDGNGTRGKMRECVLDSVFQDGEWIPSYIDTVWYEGDGEPDWRSAAPPPPPTVWAEPSLRGIRVRWNGQESETAKDIFSEIVDFEGYRVLYSLDDRAASYSVVATYDLPNYDKFVYNLRKKPDPGFELQEQPFTIDDLRCLYGQGENPCEDTTFDPLHYTFSAPYLMPGFPDSVFYFASHDYNASEFGNTTAIRKVYPDEPKPIGSVTEDQLTEDGYLKYYEYEYTIPNLLPTLPYHVNVTAFDFGSPQSGLKPMETSRTLGSKSVYPAAQADQLTGEDLDVYIYPNPYRRDAGYLDDGYEGRGATYEIPDRLRRIHFANLPPRCTISIFSLDGDLIRKLDHDMDPADPNSRYDEWNMITRNTQMIVSGIYYWVVDDLDTGRTQMGKLVVIF